MRFEDFKKKLLKNSDFFTLHNRVNLKRDIALMIEEARLARGITQEELARKIGTKQAAISRAERGNYLPSLSFLERMAKALNTELIAPKFRFLDGNQNIAVDSMMIYNTPAVNAAMDILGYGNHSSSPILYDTNENL